MKPSTTKIQRPEFGRLVWIDDVTGKTQVLRVDRWAVLQSVKKRLKGDPGLRGGKLHIKYL